jgi:hypothetical protein
VCEPGVGGSFGGAAPDLPSGGYDFEDSVESWRVGDGSAQSLTVSSSGAQHFTGHASLALSVVAPAASWFALMVDPVKTVIPAGATITLHVYVPPGAAIAWIQPYVQETANAWTWTGLFADITCLAPGVWNTLSLHAPAVGTAPLRRLGLQFYVNAPWTGAIYVDSISW